MKGGGLPPFKLVLFLGAFVFVCAMASLLVIGPSALRSGTQSSAQVLSALFAAGLPIADVGMQPAKLEDIMLKVLKGEVTE